MAITTAASYIAGTRQVCRVFKQSLTVTPGGSASLWRAAGNPGAGALPTAGNGSVPTSSTVGALRWTNPASGQKTYLSALTLLGGRGQQIVTLYDRLWHNSGFSAAITTAQTISTPPTLTRPDANGATVQLWMEVYTQVGSTPFNVSATYTNQSGTSGRTALATVPGGTVAARAMYQFALEGQDTGVRTVSQITCSANSGGAGNFGLILLRDLADCSLGMDGAGDVVDFWRSGAPEIPDSAALAMRIQIANTGTMGDMIGTVVLVQG